MKKHARAIAELLLLGVLSGLLLIAQVIDLGQASDEAHALAARLTELSLVIDRGDVGRLREYEEHAATVAAAINHRQGVLVGERSRS